MPEHKRWWAKQFKIARQKTELNKKDFSELLNINTKHYTSIEEGRAAPSKFMKTWLEKF